MDIKNRRDIELLDDACGFIQELYSSENQSIAYLTLYQEARSHKHEKMEEVYFIMKGKGRLWVGEDVYDVEKDDVIPIPKFTFHHLKNDSNKPLEVMVVTYPKYDLNDVIYEE